MTAWGLVICFVVVIAEVVALWLAALWWLGVTP